MKTLISLLALLLLCVGSVNAATQVQAQNLLLGLGLSPVELVGIAVGILEAVLISLPTKRNHTLLRLAIRVLTAVHNRLPNRAPDGGKHTISTLNTSSQYAKDNTGGVFRLKRERG